MQRRTITIQREINKDKDHKAREISLCSEIQEKLILLRRRRKEALEEKVTRLEREAVVRLQQPFDFAQRNLNFS